MDPDRRETSGVAANTVLDRRYDGMRGRYGPSSGRANGYQSERFFLRERAALWDCVADSAGPVVDLACGSGLMLAPMVAAGGPVLGLDFNQIACRDARANGLLASRGSVFALPFADASIGLAVNCQFLNQQTDRETAEFVAEVARVLRPGGRAVIFWRHAESRLHRVAGALIDGLNGLLGRPRFPQFRHPLSQVEELGNAAGLRAVRRFVTLPWGRTATVAPDTARSRWIGASLAIILEKPAVRSEDMR